MTTSCKPIIQQTEIKMPQSLRGLDLSNMVLDFKFMSLLFVYDEEFKEYIKYLNCEPPRFNTKHLKGVFKHFVTNDISFDKKKCNDLFFVGNLYKYNEISYLTGNKIYSFFCISSKGCDEIRVPCPLNEVGQYTPELYKHLIDHPEIFQNDQNNQNTQTTQTTHQPSKSAIKKRNPNITLI